MWLQDYEIIEEIGEGAFSTVYKVKEKSSGDFYAMKKIEYGRLKQKEKEYADDEINILKKIHHPNVISFKHSFFEDGFLYIIMELANGGDLQNKISELKSAGKHFPLNTILYYTFQIVQGLQALHNNSIIHRDIKPGNIFLLDNDIIKIGDFNVGTFGKHDLRQTRIGTPLIMSPEVFYGKQYGYKTDIWSLGCVVYEMATLHPVFDVESEAALFQKIMNKRIVIPNERCLEKFVLMLMKCRAEKRPTCSEILAMEIFKKFHKDDLDRTDIMKRRERKSHTSSRVPNLVNISLNKDLSIRNLHESPVSNKGRYSSENGHKTPNHESFLKCIYKCPSEFGNKHRDHAENNHEERSFRKTNLGREFSLKCIDISDIHNDLSKNSSQKNIGAKAISTPKLVPKIFNRIPINFGNKSSHLTLDRKHNPKIFLEKCSTKALNAPRTRQAAGVYLNNLYVVKSKSICRKRSQQILSSIATPKPVCKGSSMAKVFAPIIPK